MTQDQQAPAPRQAPLPKPETLVAWLVSDGKDQPTYTRHHYYGTRALPPGVDAMGRQVQEYEFLFKCFRTDAVRVWGTTCVLRDGGSYDLDSGEGVEAVN